LGKGCFEPPLHRSIKFEGAVFDELRDFPTGNDADAKRAISPWLENFAVPRLQPIRLRNPPYPNVGIQQNHFSASQSSVATGSQGRSYSRTESRRL
jgi:hypothetical protein